MWPTKDQVIPWCVNPTVGSSNWLIEVSSDAAGEVVGVGTKTTRFKAGSRVTTVFFQNFSAGKLTLDGTTTDLGGRSDGVLRQYALQRAKSRGNACPPVVRGRVNTPLCRSHGLELSIRA